MERKTRAEGVGNPFYKEAIEQRAGPGYGYIEAQVLHGFMRALAPPRIIEIGSGVSTSCMLAARELNRTEGKTFSEIICVEPYPSALMRNQPVSLIEKPVEKVTPPGNAITLGKVKQLTKKGIAMLKVTVPAPGKLVLSGPKVKTVTLNPTAAGEESIAIRPTGKALSSLRKRGKVSVRVKLVFIPTGGTPSTTGKTVVLIEK